MEEHGIEDAGSRPLKPIEELRSPLPTPAQVWTCLVVRDWVLLPCLLLRRPVCPRPTSFSVGMWEVLPQSGTSFSSSWKVSKLTLPF